MTVADERWPGRVRTAFSERLGVAVTLEDGFGPVTVDVPADRWVEAVTLARDGLGCTFFDWLSAVDELTEGFRVVCHVARHRPGAVEHLVLRTLVDREAPTVESVGQVFAGARWHERETHEMFGIGFDGHPHLVPLLLPDGFTGHPLRKDFVLAARVAKEWPGAKEPGESHTGVTRRRMRPPGVPDDWGPAAGRPAGADRPGRRDRPPRAPAEATDE